MNGLMVVASCGGLTDGSCIAPDRRVTELFLLEESVVWLPGAHEPIGILADDVNAFSK